MRLLNFKKVKIRLFDVLILSLFILIAFSLYFILFRTTKNLTVVVKTFEDSVSWPGQRSAVWFNKLFYPGMVQKDNLGNIVATVINVRKYDNRPDASTVYLTLKLKTVYTPGTRIYTYNGRNVLIGSIIQLYLENINVEAMVVNMQGVEDRYPQKKLLIQSQLTNPESGGILSYIPDNIPVGTKIKDSRNKVVLTILKKDVEPAQKIVTTDKGEIVLTKDPIRKDVYLTLEVQAYKVDSRYFFFDDIPVLIDGQIPIHLPKISIFPTITSIEEVR